MPAGSRSRVGRRTGESTTRDDILAAARKLFGRTGFKGTSLRAVAAEAGVDVALVSYYFGSKHGLFVAAMEAPVDPAEQVRTAMSGPRSEIGERIITTFTQIWEGPDTGTAMQGLLRSVINDADRSHAFASFAAERMVPLVIETAEVSLDTARLAISTLFGLATMRYLIEVPTFADLTRDEVIALYGPRLQALIDAD